MEMIDTKALRNKILDLAVRGKLVPQDPNDEPASVLLERIREEKEQLIKEKKIKRNKNESVIFKAEDNLHYEKFADGSVNLIEEEIPFEVPAGWAWQRINMLMLPQKNTKPTGRTFKYIDISAIDNTKQIIENSTILLTENRPSRANKKLDTGDTIFSMVRPYLKNIAFIDKKNVDGIASSGFYVFKPFKQCWNPFFLFQIIKSSYFVNGINQKMKGDNSPSVRKEDIDNFLIPVPPINEQDRIVEKIKVLDYEIDNIIYKQSKISQFHKILNSKILSLAMQGKLVPQNALDEPSSILLERINAKKQQLIAEGKLKQNKNESIIIRRGNSYYEKIDYKEKNIDKLIPFKVPASWCWERLGNLVITNNGLTYRPTDVSTDGVPVLRGTNIQRGKIDYSDLIFVNPKTKIRQNEFLAEGDILMSVRSGSANLVGKSAIIRTKESQLSFGAFMSVIRPLEIKSQYLHLYIESCFFKSQMKNTNSTQIKQITQKMIKEALIPIPPFNEQIRIINKIKALRN